MEGGHGWLIQSDEGKCSTVLCMHEVLLLCTVSYLLITKYAHDNRYVDLR